MWSYKVIYNQIWSYMITYALHKIIYGHIFIDVPFMIICDVIYGQI